MALPKSVQLEDSRIHGLYRIVLEPVAFPAGQNCNLALQAMKP